MCTAIDMRRSHPNLTDPPNGVFVSSLTLKQLSDALRCLGWQPDKGALPRRGRDASPGAFAPMPARVLIACEVQPFDEDANVHGSLGRAAQDFTRCRAIMGLVVALPHLDQIGKPWTAGRARMPHHDVHEVQPCCLPCASIDVSAPADVSLQVARALRLKRRFSPPARALHSCLNHGLRRSFPWPANAILRPSTQSRPPYPSPSISDGGGLGGRSTTYLT